MNKTAAMVTALIATVAMAVILAFEIGTPRKPIPLQIGQPRKTELCPSEWACQICIQTREHELELNSNKVVEVSVNGLIWYSYPAGVPPRLEWSFARVRVLAGETTYGPNYGPTGPLPEEK